MQKFPLEMTKLYPDRNLTWYLDVSEVNKALAPCHFQNDDVVQPSLYFWRALVIECLENTTGAELGDNGLPKRFYQIPVYTPCDKQQDKNMARFGIQAKRGKSETERSKAALSEIFKIW